MNRVVDLFICVLSLIFSILFPQYMMRLVLSRIVTPISGIQNGKAGLKKREVKNKLAKSAATLNMRFKHDVDEEISLDVGKCYIPSSLKVVQKYKNSSSASPLSLYRRMQSEKPEKRTSSQVPGGSGDKPSLLTLDSSNTSSENFNDYADVYLYRQPQLNKAPWETTPRTYWD